MSSPPLVLITAGRLICPVCRALDTIAEEHLAVRLNTLGVRHRDGTVVLHAWLGGRGDFARARFLCQACLATVAVPHDLADSIRYHD